MQHKLITTENYLLVVDDSEIKAGDLVIENQELNQIFQVQDINKVNGLCRSKVDTYVIDSCKKITAHLPLNNSPILEGVDLLPPLEDEVDKLARQFAIDESYGKISGDLFKGFIFGYNKAKEKYKYTEEDLAKIFYVGVQLGINQEIAVTSNKPLQDEDAVLKKCIQSLQQPKMPVAFECEMENYCGSPYTTERCPKCVDICDKAYQRPKKTTNSQGLTQWVGEYIYG